MTTAIRFSRQNDAGLRASNTQYWENIALVVVLVSESKALYYGHIIIYLGKTTNRNHLFFPLFLRYDCCGVVLKTKYFSLAWESSRHFSTLPMMVFPRRDVWEASAELPYWWRVATQICVLLLLIGWSTFPTRHDQSKPLLDQGRDTSSVWYFCARSLDVISRGISKCRPFLHARFSTTTSLYVLNTALCLFIFGSGGCFWRPSASYK